MRRKNKGISMAAMITSVTVFIAAVVLGIMLMFFIRMYKNSITSYSVTNSEQAVGQAADTVESYTDSIDRYMALLVSHIADPEESMDEFMDGFMELCNEAVAVMIYDQDGGIIRCWSGDYDLKEEYYKNLSYDGNDYGTGIHISEPHVETVLEEYYPWVVTVSQNTCDEYGEEILVSMDIRFSTISEYVDNVGIGQHGYCFIIDDAGSLIYHPQQALIYMGLKEEDTAGLTGLGDGTHITSNTIYTIQSLEGSSWMIVGVSYLEEMVTEKFDTAVKMCVVLFLMMLVTAVFVGALMSGAFSKPVKQLTDAMAEFEDNAEDFEYKPVGGIYEIELLSDSFGHMVVRVQNLVERVRQEEVTLRRTELNALQAQINPHFLYNTLDSIAWMCEEGRSREAVEMVNALAKLFRVSISRGHELIPIRKELEHAGSYLKIQKYRYGDGFTYEMDVDESCLDYLCSKITLQPLIENAIYHGIEGMDGEGRITVHVHEDGDDILMAVEDNGIGMTQEQCRHILKKESGEESGIGVKNVNDRIQIYFGRDYGLRFISEPDEGTIVEIRIPKTMGDGHAGT